MKLFLDKQVVSPDVPDARRRMSWAVVAVIVAFCLLAGRAWQLQVLRGQRYFERTTENIVHTTSVPAVRGRILDRAGVVLADNRPAFDVVVQPARYTRDTHDALMRLVGAEEEISDRVWLRVDRARGRYHVVPVLEDVDRDVLALVEQERAALPGVSVRDQPHRTYPFGALAAHVTGYLNEVNEEELDRVRDEGYEPGDTIGRYGIEKRWENYLRGKKGLERFVMDARGNRKERDEVEGLVDDAWFEPPVPGNNVVLTLDIALQQAAIEALAPHPSGAVAVVEVASGRILALVSTPAFDSNVMSGRLTRAQEAELTDNPHKPFLDKTLRMHYPPGSTYKLVTGLAALEAGQARPGEVIKCNGSHRLGSRVFHCNKTHGPVDLYDAIGQSCNVYFWTLAERIGMDAIASVAHELGFGTPTGLGLNGDIAGRVPTRALYEARGGFQMGHTWNTAIGQGDTEVTVLQLAMAYAAIANGGYLWVPQLVDRVVTATGEVVVSYAPTLRRRVALSEASLRVVREGLWRGSNTKKGSSASARPEGLSVAGKTGTAQVRRLGDEPEGEGWHPDRDHAWFAGYAPTEDPKIAVIVLVEHGGSGGKVAAPVAMKVIEAYASLSAAPPRVLRAVPEGAP